MGSHADPEHKPASEGASGVAPLERFAAPSTLTGELGSHRLPCADCRVRVRNDRDAVFGWLANVATAGRTYDCYRSAAEKLLNWACFERRVALSSLENEDLLAFAAFLSAPAPGERWMCTRGTRRESNQWRPFCGPLSPVSRRAVMGAIASLFEWMAQQGYARMPIVSGLRCLRNGFGRQSACATTLLRRKSEPLSYASWHWVELRLADDNDTPTLATRLVIELLYFAGMRVSDVRSLREYHCVAPTTSFPTWRLYLSSLPPTDPWVYALPPLANTLSEWFGERKPKTRTVSLAGGSWESERVLSGCDTLFSQVRLLLQQAGELAATAGDKAAAQELRRSTPFVLSHAIEIHGKNDVAFSNGIVAHPRFRGTYAIQYVDRIPMTRRLMLHWWRLLRHLWATYPQHLPEESKVVATPATRGSGKRSGRPGAVPQRHQHTDSAPALIVLDRRAASPRGNR